MEVFAVPDATAFATLESALRPAATPVPIRPAPAVQLDEARRLVQSAVERRWPDRTAGSVLSVSMTAAATDALDVEVAHLGAALDDMTRETLERALTEDLERTVTIRDVALPADELAAAAGDVAFVARVAPLLRASRRLASISVCIVQPRQPPSPPARPKGQPPEDPLRPVMLELLDGHPRASFAPGDTWRIRFVAGPCPAVEPADSPVQD